MQEMITGDKIGGGRERKRKRRRINIAAQCQTNIRHREKWGFRLWNGGRGASVPPVPETLTERERKGQEARPR